METPEPIQEQKLAVERILSSDPTPFWQSVIENIHTNASRTIMFACAIGAIVDTAHQDQWVKAGAAAAFYLGGAAVDRKKKV